MNYSSQIPPAQPFIKTYVMESKEVSVGKCFTAWRVEREVGCAAGAQSPLCTERCEGPIPGETLSTSQAPGPHPNAPCTAHISKMSTAANPPA